MSITEKFKPPPKDNEEAEDDFVNISIEEEEDERKAEDERENVDFSDDRRSANNAVDEFLDERKPAAVIYPSRRTQSSGSNNSNAAASAGSVDDGNYFEDDRKPAASPSRSQSKDARFMCAICLDEVSDEPVVTRCGHLFCWPCLYQWFAPGMLMNEYYAAFGGGGDGIGRAANHGGSRGNLNHFISEMATPSSHSQNNRPYDQSRWNAQRRVCPVCKAFCSVDSVIPIYIHVHANADGSQADQREDTITQSDAQQQSQNEDHHLESTRDSDESPPLSAHLLDPTAANIGLRQRRPPTTTTSTSSTSSINNAPRQDGLCDSPPQNDHHHIYENIPSNATRTPVIRNGGVPNRPLPTPTPLYGSNNNNSSLQTPTSQHQQQGGQYEDQNVTAAPMLNTSTITSSSSFRLAYRPRHVDYSRSIQFQNRQMGGLMGIVSGLVHSIDNIGVANQQSTHQGTTRDASAVPQIHRSDHGLGGIGRASEQNSERSSAQVGGNGAASVMGGEDSSLAMAREFLSRLLFMLACFVILCLLLF